MEDNNAVQSLKLWFCHSRYKKNAENGSNFQIYGGENTNYWNMEEIMHLRCSNSQCSINRYYKTSMPRLGSIGSAWNHVPLSEQLSQNNMFRHVPVSERLSHVSTNHETRVRIPVGANFSLHSVQMLQNSTNGKLVT